jgi:hypothetical protein
MTAIQTQAAVAAVLAAFEHYFNHKGYSGRFFRLTTHAEKQLLHRICLVNQPID